MEKTHYSATNPTASVNLADIPLFVLTSQKTFSAAEACLYPLQAYERVTVIGEVTRGGANAGDIIPLNDELQIFIS